MKINWVSDHPSLGFVGQSVVARNYLSRFKQLGHEVVATGFNAPQDAQTTIPVDYPVHQIQ
ncbi:MAG TPA: hypothetical protein VNX68_08490, partial [Nitrosopumilaceae archaeon]|nr:hypothetical protein [Nitrosopumilaceae archaeon]